MSGASDQELAAEVRRRAHPQAPCLPPSPPPAGVECSLEFWQHTAVGVECSRIERAVFYTLPEVGDLIVSLAVGAGEWKVTARRFWRESGEAVLELVEVTP